MLLKNYYTLLDAHVHTYKLSSNEGRFTAKYAIPGVKLGNGSDVAVTVDMCGGSYFKDKLATYFWSNPPSASEIYTTIPTSSVGPASTYIAFGSGTTPPTIDDYTVESIISNIAATSTRVIDIDNGHRTYITYTNNNPNSITISEVVMFGNMSGFSSAYQPALLREVFDTPIVVEAGESFIYSWDYVTGD